MVMTRKKGKSPFSGKVAENLSEKGGMGGNNYLAVGGDIPFFRPKRDEQEVVYLDFLPYTVKKDTHPDRSDRKERARKGDWWWKHDFLLHRNIGVNKTTVICPRTEGKSCPICEHRFKRLDEDGQTKETDNLRASRRILYIVVPRKHPKYEEKPHLFEMAFKNFGELLRMELKRDPEKEVFPDPDEGMTLEVSFMPDQIEANSPKYAKAFRIDFHERNEPISDELLDSVPNLDDIIKVPTTKEVHKLFWQDPDEAEDEEGEAEDEETPFKEGEDEGKEEAKPTEDATPRKPKQAKAEQVEEKSDEEEEDKESKRERRKQRRKERQEGKAETTKNECPYGHNFGYDWDAEKNKKDCDKCPQETWDRCADENEKIYG